MRLSCSGVRDAIAAAPLCPPVIEPYCEGWPNCVRGRCGLRRFHSAYLAARSMRLEDPFYRFARPYSTATLPNAVTNDDLRMYCSGLTELCVVRTYLLTDAGIAAVAAGLRALYLDGCHSITGEALIGVTSSARTVFFYNGDGDSLLDAHLANLGSCTHVRLGPCRRLTDAGVARLRSVTELHIKQCGPLSAAAFAGRPPLRALGLSFVRLLPSFPHDTFEPICGTLTRLRLEVHKPQELSCTFTDELVRPLAHVTDAFLGNCRVTDAGVRHLSAATSLHLFQIDLRGNDLSGLNNLTHLTCHGCYQMEGRALRTLPRLRSLFLLYSPMIVPEAVIDAARTCPELARIDLQLLHVGADAWEKGGENYRTVQTALGDADWEFSMEDDGMCWTAVRRGVPRVPPFKYQWHFLEW